MKVELRLIKKDDLKKIMGWRMREDITRYMNTDPKLTIEGQAKWLEKISKDSTQRNWVIYVDNEAAGFMNIFEIDEINSRCSWGYYVAEKAIRSLKLATYLEWNLYDYVFEDLALNKLCNETFAQNKQIVQLHKMCGSKVDGIMREHIRKNDEFYDVVVGSILSSDWKEIKEKKTYEKIHFE